MLCVMKKQKSEITQWAATYAANVMRSVRVKITVPLKMDNK